MLALHDRDFVEDVGITEVLLSYSRGAFALGEVRIELQDPYCEVFREKPKRRLLSNRFHPLWPITTPPVILFAKQ